MRDAVYLVGFLVGAVVLLLIGHGQLPSSTVLTWGLTFGATAAVGVLLISLYRVQLELKHSRSELARKQAEIQFAREVQAALFPRELPADRGLSFTAICIPAQGISGDYYDIVECPDGRIVVAIADISGKGISAAILMSNLQARFRALVEYLDHPAEVCNRLNRHFVEFTDPERFATFFFAQWRPGSGEVEYVNCGHQVPLLCGSTRAEMDAGGPPLGLFSGIRYQSGSIRTRPGDLIVLYSDGISEAPGPDDTEFGVERLQRVIDQGCDRPLRTIQQSVLQALSEWSGREPHDDMTIVLVRIEQPVLGERRFSVEQVEESGLRPVSSIGEGVR